MRLGLLLPLVVFSTSCSNSFNSDGEYGRKSLIGVDIPRCVQSLEKLKQLVSDSAFCRDERYRVVYRFLGPPRIPSPLPSANCGEAIREIAPNTEQKISIMYSLTSRLAKDHYRLRDSEFPSFPEQLDSLEAAQTCGENLEVKFWTAANHMQNDDVRTTSRRGMYEVVNRGYSYESDPFVSYAFDPISLIKQRAPSSEGQHSNIISISLDDVDDVIRKSQLIAVQCVEKSYLVSADEVLQFLLGKMDAAIGIPDGTPAPKVSNRTLSMFMNYVSETEVLLLNPQGAYFVDREQTHAFAQDETHAIRYFTNPCTEESDVD